jgi:CHRD domain-containing protein
MRSRTIRLGIVALTGAAILATAVLAEGSPSGEQAGRPAVRLARMTGEVEVPTGDLDGSGLATVIVHPGRGRLCFAIVVDDIVLPATGAHVHKAPAGVAGDIVVPLTAPDATGTSAGCVSADPGLLTAIKRHPRQYYVNVHTTDFPAGAVRGQLHRP